MKEKHTDSCFEIDDSLYLVRETDKGGKAFVLTDKGTLREVSSGYVMAMGSPVSKEYFFTEVKKLGGLRTEKGAELTSEEGGKIFQSTPKSSRFLCDL